MTKSMQLQAEIIIFGRNKRINMKRTLVYFLGILTGVVLTICVLFIVKSVIASDSSITYFEQPTPFDRAHGLTVLQTLEDGSALATNFVDLIVLLVNKTGASFYDGQIIEPQRGEKFVQIGLYRYKTKNKDWKTVPAIRLEGNK